MSSRPDLGPGPRLAFAGSRIERAADRRADAAALAALAHDSGTRSYLIGGETVALKKTSSGHDPLFTAAEIGGLGETAEVAFIGLLDGAARFAVLEGCGQETFLAEIVWSRGPGNRSVVRDPGADALAGHRGRTNYADSLYRGQ